MARTSSSRSERAGFSCTECGWTAPKWVGRCGECQTWGTVVEVGAPHAGPATKATTVRGKALPIGDISVEAVRHVPTGVGELDRVLGGGFVPGAVVLLAGEPGVGKSTLLLDVAGRSARAGHRVLYITGEESAGQVRLRADRIGASEPDVLLAAETDLGAVLAHIDEVQPAFLLVDSIQTISSTQVEGTPGGVSQVREVAASLVQAAKNAGIPTVIVGHVTKEGSIAGPRIVEHLVDVVCTFEGEQHSTFRILRAVKNRFGAVDEVGCFQLTDTGIVEVADPSGVFLTGIERTVPGTCATITVDGKRPLPAEVQALVSPSALASPRRATSGIDSSRVAMIIAVLHRRAGVVVGDNDVYVSTVGGARVTEPAADLSLALALASARKDVAVRTGVVACGEVALSGEIRPVHGTTQRIAEAARLGFTDVILPHASIPSSPEGVRLHPVAHLRDAISIALEKTGA